MPTRIIILALAMLAASIAEAQRPGNQGNRRGRPGAGRPRGGPPGFHLMTALDINKDGKISATEIKNALIALTKLDKDKDGKLSAAEIGWPPAGGFGGFFGGRRGGGRGGRGGGRGGRGGFGGFGGFFGGGEEEDENASPKRRPDPDRDRDAFTLSKPFFTAKQLAGLDRNKDGKITKAEIPKGLRKLILGRLDKNKDGVVSKAELSSLK